jgi:hypothetical protein
LGQCTNEEKFLFPEQFMEETGHEMGGLLAAEQGDKRQRSPKPSRRGWQPNGN